MIDAEFLEIVACPACRAEVRLEGDSVSGRIVCTSPTCGLRYPIRDGLPILLVDEAEKPVAAPGSGRS